MSPALEVRNLTTRFNTPEGVVNAVSDVSFSVMNGETVAIVGESGSGKSVTMLSIQGLLPAHSGRIEAGQVLFDGRDLLTLTRKEMRSVNGSRIGMIFQDPMSSLNPVLPVGFQIGESMRRHLGLSADEARERSIELATLVGISAPEQRLNDYPHQFSGGMRQRVMIAMALACSPRLLIADEPTTALDVTIQAQILRLVRRLKATFDMSLIWITHDLGVVAKLADRVIVMYAGRVVEEADVRDFYREPSIPIRRVYSPLFLRPAPPKGGGLPPLADSHPI